MNSMGLKIKIMVDGYHESLGMHIKVTKYRVLILDPLPTDSVL